MSVSTDIFLLLQLGEVLLSCSGERTGILLTPYKAQDSTHDKGLHGTQC